MNAISKSTRGTRLRAVAPKAAEPSKPKVLIYGKPGVGKTWQALDFPSVFYVDTEGGANLQHYTDKLERAGGVYLGPEQGSLDFGTVIEQIDALSTERHDFRTVVIDSITKLFQSTIANEAERLEREHKKNEFGADKRPAVSYMRRLVSKLTRLDMNVLLIAHEITEWGTDAQGNRAEVGATFDAWPKLEYELHLALHVTKQGASRWAKVRKTRLLGFPDGERFAWDYDTFAERYGREIIEGEVKPLVLASPEEVAEIDRLVNTVKLADGWVEKTLAAANAETWSELTEEQASKTLDFLNQKLKGAAL